MAKDTRELVGHIGVDAGIIWVGDPCYVMGDDATNRVKDWNAYCHASFDPANEVAKDVKEPLGHHVGLEIGTNYGDGTYPVYIERDADGRPARVIVDFLPGEDDD